MRPAETLVRPRPFFGLTLLLSWVIWIPLVLAHFEVGSLRIEEGVSSAVRLLGVLMPAVAALVLTARKGGRLAVRSLLARLKIADVGWRWWLAAAVAQPALLITIGLLFNVLGGQPAVTPVEGLVPAALLINVILLAIATLGEEIGWRGVALPALQQHYGSLTASGILGLVTVLWHVPFWLLLDTFTQFGVGYLVLNALLILPMTVYITWFSNHSRASLLLPVAFHLTFNIVNVALLPVTSTMGAFGAYIAVQWLMALWLVRRITAVEAGQIVPVTI